MPLQEEMEQQGNYLFKYRGTLPLIILIIGLGIFALTIYRSPLLFAGTFWDKPYEFICLGVCFTGLFIRILIVGYTPKNTSGRNTEKQVADELNTTGIYSVVRHPLYLGNFFMWFGVGMLTRNIWFLLLFIFIYWIYYERIMFAEEQFLRKKFGEVYLKWASKTPAFIPAFKQWKKPNLNFSMKKVLKKEKNGFFAIFLVFILFQLTGNYLISKKIYIDSFWLTALIVSGSMYLILTVLKKKTTLLDEKGR